MYEAKDYESRIWWSAEDEAFVAQVLEMPGIMAHGATRAEAAENVQTALEGGLAWMVERGDTLPVPNHRAIAA